MLRFRTFFNLTTSFILFFISVNVFGAEFGPEVTDVVILIGKGISNTEETRLGYELTLGPEHVITVGDGRRYLKFSEVTNAIERVRKRPRTLFVIMAHGYALDHELIGINEEGANLQKIEHLAVFLTRENRSSAIPIGLLFLEFAKLEKPVDVLMESCFGGACAHAAQLFLPTGSNYAAMGNEIEKIDERHAQGLAWYLEEYHAKLRPFSLAKIFAMVVGEHVSKVERIRNPIFGIAGKGTVYSETLADEFTYEVSVDEKKRLMELSAESNHEGNVDLLLDGFIPGVHRDYFESTRKMITFFKTDWFSAPASTFEATKPCRLLMSQKIEEAK